MTGWLVLAGIAVAIVGGAWMLRERGDTMDQALDRFFENDDHKARMAARGEYEAHVRAGLADGREELVGRLVAVLRRRMSA